MAPGLSRGLNRLVGVDRDVQARRASAALRHARPDAIEGPDLSSQVGFATAGARIADGLLELEEDGSEQKVDELQAVGRARVEPTYRRNGEPSQSTVDLPLDVLLEEDSSGGRVVVGEHGDELWSADVANQELLGQPFVGGPLVAKAPHRIVGMTVGHEAGEASIRADHELEGLAIEGVVRTLELFPVQLLEETALLSQPVQLAQHNAWLAQLEHADRKEAVGRDRPRLIEEGDCRGMVLGQPTLYRIRLAMAGAEEDTASSWHVGLVMSMIPRCLASQPPLCKIQV